ncbi:MAG: exodeoxyribonuclease VII large subunit [Omnitrophica bacterium]|nr:exodeoxyribonuclease VII large subunit [Candidatus Omnitrophota bacterium]
METLTEKRIYTVSQVTRDIRTILEDAFGEVWIEGEVSNFIRHQSGHMYFSIKDAGGVLSCVFFRGANSNLKFEIKNGMHVLIFGKISVYDKRGQYQLYVRRIEPKGAGALQIALEQLKEKLRKEGLFDEARKKPIPYLPQRVGIITSPTGAAIRDMLKVSKGRFSNIEIILNPVRVQGEEAKNEIAEALDLFNEIDNVDVIILGRGGGSLEDLWSFNEEIVARAVYRSRIPVISAVGHEVDWTISDLCADKRAETPSAAAALVIPKKEDLVAALRNLKERMAAALISKSEILSERLRTITKRYVFREPLNMLRQREQEIDDLSGDLALKGGYTIKFKQESLNALAGKLHTLSPLGILNRGYSITRREKDGKAIKDAKAVTENELINTRLAHGEVVSRVEKILTEELWEK